MDFLFFWLGMRVRYDRIAQDADRKEKSSFFGVQSILCSLFGMAAVILCAFGIRACMQQDSALLILFIALLVIVMLVALVQCTSRALVATIYQMKLNKKPIGWVSLVLWIIALVAMVAVSVLMVSGVLK